MIGGDEINTRLGVLEAYGAREMGSKCYLQSTNFRIRMSEEGHERRLDDVRGMSACPPIADMMGVIAYGRDVPGATLFDHLICKGE